MSYAVQVEVFITLECDHEGCHVSYQCPEQRGTDHATGLEVGAEELKEARDQARRVRGWDYEWGVDKDFCSEHAYRDAEEEGYLAAENEEER